MKWQFDKKFFIISLLALAVGLFLFFFSSGFVRNYIGDAVVVIFLYSFLSSFVKTRVIYRAGLILALALIIEFSQMIFSAPDNQLSELILGGNFDIFDIFAYILGITSISIYEIISKNKP